MPLSAREQKLCNLIRARESALVADLKLHVALPTGGRNTQALDESRERLTTRAKALGATIDLIPGDPRPDWLYGEVPNQTPLPTAICRRNSVGDGGRELLIAGHLDTVHDPNGPFRALTINPDGKSATGPGSVDMKGGLVIALAALEALEEVGERLPWTLLLNSDEEAGSYHSARAIHNEAARVAAANGLGIALEPATADGGLVIERAGSGQFMIECRGKSAHVGRDFASGISAVDALADTILRVRALAAQHTDIIVNIGPLQGGPATNIVPDLARAWGNIRFQSPSAADVFIASLQSLAGRAANGAVITIQSNIARPAKPLTPEVKHIADLCCATAQVLNQQLPFSKTAGVCDGNLMQAAGLPTIDTLGVRGGGLHTPEEWIDLSSLVDRCQLLALVMLRASDTDTRPTHKA